MGNHGHLPKQHDPKSRIFLFNNAHKLCDINFSVYDVMFLQMLKLETQNRKVESISTPQLIDKSFLGGVLGSHFVFKIALTVFVMS